MDNEITGWEKHGTHRFPGGLGIHAPGSGSIRKKTGDGFVKVDEDAKLPFE